MISLLFINTEEDYTFPGAVFTPGPTISTGRMNMLMRFLMIRVLRKAIKNRHGLMALSKGGMVHFSKCITNGITLMMI